MPRKGPAPRRELMPDPIYGSVLVTRIINKVLVRGKRSTAERIVYEALATIEVHSIFGRYKVDGRGMNSHEGLTFQILKGQRKVVWPEKWAETKPELPMPEWSKR